MISPSFATMLCFVQTDALVDAVTLDRLLRAAVERSFERISVDGQLSTNDSVFCDRERRGRRRRSSPGSDDELAFARGARRAAAPARARDRRRRRGRRAGRAARGARRGGGGRPGRARGRQLAAREVRAARAATRTGAASSQAAGQAVPDADLSAARPLHRGRPGRERAAARWRSTTTAARRLDEAMSAAEVEMRLDLARRRRGGRDLLLRPRARSTCASTRSTRREHRPRAGPAGAADRDAARVAPLHPGVLRRDDRDQVRRRGDGRGAAARGLRHATSCCSSTSG